MSDLIPTEIQLSQRTRELTIRYATNETFVFTCRFLRQNSPSAANTTEVSPDVNISAIEPVGQYAIKLAFDDGHNTGIYSWDYLYQLGKDLV